MYHDRTNAIIDARAFIFSSNETALVIDSASVETKITFLNSSTNRTNLRPRLEIAASNQDFVFYQDSNELLRLGASRVSASNSVIYGQRFEVYNKNVERRNLVLDQTVPGSDYQFAGIGFKNGILNYQVPTTNNKHVFYSGATPNASYELLRIESTAYGATQLAVGVPSVTMSSNTVMHVGGDTQIDGKLIVKGGVDFSATGLVSVDSNTQRIRPSVLPSNVVILNGQNQIDESVLPYKYNFNFLKFQQNVGIGVRVPLEKFHVQGSAIISNKLTIGSNAPSSTTSAYLNIMASGSLPAIVVDRQAGAANIVEIRASSSALFTINASGSVGIGTNSIPSSTAFWANGNIVTQNNIICSTMTSSNMITSKFAISNTYGVPVLRTVDMLKNGLYTTVVQSLNEFQCYDNLATNYISTTSASVGTVSFSNCGIYVQKQSTFDRPIVTVSDARAKTNVLRLENSLDKIIQLSGYSYQLNTDPSKQTYIGLIAQEVERVFPEVVRSGASGTDYMGIQYDSMIGILVECIKELANKVDKLAAALPALPLV